MAFKLTKADRAIIDPLILAYENAATALCDALSDIVSDWEATFDERSEQWQESDAADAATEAMDSLRNIVDQIEDIELELPS